MDVIGIFDYQSDVGSEEVTGSIPVASSSKKEGFL